MAHRIEYRDERHSFFEVNANGQKTAWHKLGEVLTVAPGSVKEALAACRADYEVEVRPLSFTKYTNDDDTFNVPSKLASAIVRTDTQCEVGSASPGYEVMQNEDAFRVLDPLIGEGLATVETGGVLRDGADPFLLVRWNLDKFSEGVRGSFGGELLPYALMTNSHSGRRGIALMDTAIRVVCANTVALAYSAKSPRVIVKHSSKAMGKVIDAAHELWGNIIGRYDAVAEQYNVLRRTVITEEEFRAAVLDVIAPMPNAAPGWKDDGKFSKTLMERAEAKRLTLSTLWHHGAGHSGNGSAWEAVQGAVEALDHDTAFLKARSAEARASALLADGSLGKLKQTVYNNVLALAVAAK